MPARNNKCFTIVGLLRALISFARTVHCEQCSSKSQMDATLVLELNSTKPRRGRRIPFGNLRRLRLCIFMKSCGSGRAFIWGVGGRGRGVDGASLCESLFNWIPRKDGKYTHTDGVIFNWNIQQKATFVSRCLPPGLSATSFSAPSAPIDPQVPLTGWWECELWPSFAASHLSVWEWIVRPIKDHLWSRSLAAGGDKREGRGGGARRSGRRCFIISLEKESPARSEQLESLSLAADFTCDFGFSGSFDETRHAVGLLHPDRSHYLLSLANTFFCRVSNFKSSPRPLQPWSAGA